MQEQRQKIFSNLSEITHSFSKHLAGSRNAKMQGNMLSSRGSLPGGDRPECKPSVVREATAVCEGVPKGPQGREMVN